MSDESKARWRLSTIGWITLALGGVGLIRLVAELLFIIGGSPKGFYYLVLVADVLLGVGAVVVGYLLTRPGRLSWPSTVALWGAWVGNSVVIFSSILGHVTQSWRSGETRVLFPRMLFYVVVLAVSPWVLWSLLTLEEAERPPRAKLWRRLAGGFVVAVVLRLLIMYQK